MCERTSEHYRRVAGYRYDPAERLEKSRRYAEAAKRIRSGACTRTRSACRESGAGEPGGPGPRGATLDRSNAGAIAGARGRVEPRNVAAVPSFGDSLDLPVLEQDRRTSAQESHDGHEVISVGALDHLADDAGERAVDDAHRGAHGDRRLFGDEQSRVDHGVNLTKVAGSSES